MTDDEVAESLRVMFDDAIELAARAKAEIETATTVGTKRGGPRLNPSYRLWDSAVQNACRLARLLAQREADPKSLGRELTRLLESEQR